MHLQGHLHQVHRLLGILVHEADRLVDVLLHGRDGLGDLGGHGPFPLQRRADVAKDLDAALRRFLLKFHSGAERRLEGFHGLMEQVARLVRLLC